MVAVDVEEQIRWAEVMNLPSATMRKQNERNQFDQMKIREGLTA